MNSSGASNRPGSEEDDRLSRRLGSARCYLRTRGRYRMEGDRLLLAITRMEEWQKYAVGPNPGVNTSAPRWSERGTLAVDGDRLIHTYVSAPADAPETFT